MSGDEKMSSSNASPSAMASPTTSGVEPSAAFTPRPWRAGLGHNGEHQVRGPGSNVIATVFHTPDGLGAANADLVAAAPDLLEALTLIVENADDISEYTTMGGDHVVRAVHLKRARAAIGRALDLSAQDTSEAHVEGPGTPSTPTPSAHVGKPTATESGEGSGLVQRLNGVTEDDAYASPWTFGELCREAAARIQSLERELAEVREYGDACRKFAVQGAIALRRARFDPEAGLIDAGLHALERARAAAKATGQ